MNYVIIVAGGKGLRMGADIPKQFLPIGGKPILMHTIERFRGYSAQLNIILVLPKEQQPYWQRLCAEYHFRISHTIVDGGETRFHSVQNGLKHIPDTAVGIVGVHDGVRPFAAVDVISRLYACAQVHRAAVPVIPLVESLRRVDAAGGSEHVLRNDYRLVQTPQVFDIALFRQAYRQPYREAFTDDATVIEAYGQQIIMVEGNRENIKITTPFDLVMAEALIAHHSDSDQ